jgi:hypothetical protein
LLLKTKELIASCRPRGRRRAKSFRCRQHQHPDAALWHRPRAGPQSRGGARWVTRTYFSRTARKVSWWEAFEHGERQDEQGERGDRDVGGDPGALAPIFGPRPGFRSRSRYLSRAGPRTRRGAGSRAGGGAGAGRVHTGAGVRSRPRAGGRPPRAGPSVVRQAAVSVARRATPRAASATAPCVAVRSTAPVAPGRGPSGWRTVRRPIGRSPRSGVPLRAVCR